LGEKEIEEPVEEPRSAILLCMSTSFAHLIVN